MNMDIKQEAKYIIYQHTANMILSAHYEPKDSSELWEYMGEECGYLLADKFLEGKYTPLEYNAIRNEIAKLLGDIFDPVCTREMHDQFNGIHNLH